METVTGYSFRPGDLRAGERAPGVSGFMRIRNGADFLEATIRSHIGAFDEIVAVYNQCTDATPDILARLAQEYGPKLRVFHYADRVYPPGSKEHAAEPENSPHSVVNYSNFALSRTRHAVVSKVDDDHLAIGEALQAACDGLRAGRMAANAMYCFSGLNLARGRDGRLAAPATDMISGSGDIGFFRAAADTFFAYDRRFERFRSGALKRRFAGFLYWHLKYMKAGQGFANYELERNPESRFARRLQRFQGAELIDLADVRRRVAAPALRDRLLGLVHAKRALLVERNRAVAAAFPQASFEAALDATSPGWREWLG